MAADANIKKVKPYPFKANMKDAFGTFAGHVVKLTLQGLMIEVGGTSVQPGDKVEVNFTTPVLNGVVVVAGVVVKVYNQMTGGTGAAVSVPGSAGVPGAASNIRLVEIHFKSVLPESMNHIARFLEQTGQVRRG